MNTTDENYAHELAREGVAGIIERMRLDVDPITVAYMERAYLQGRLDGLRWTQTLISDEYRR